jgi:histidyl-tRNA synthetase
MIQTLRGMRDFVGEDSIKYEYFISIATDIVKKANFNFIQTPILEETRLFKRSVGDSSDIVNKEMYNFIDKGNNDVCLRPEATASVVRSFIEHKFDKAGGIYRYFYYGPMFRYERPQKGRFRQFYQFGCESFGISSVYEDVMIINIIYQIFDKLNISSTLEINSLGCNSCMPNYKKDLQNKLKKISDNLCNDCKIRVDKNPMRVFDCKNTSCQEKLANISKISDNLCDDCINDFDILQNTLKSLDIPYKINKNLVRGLDYYNKTAFEFISTDIGSQNAIAGGGRYDNLVSMLDGVSSPSVGFALGIDRILDLIQVPVQREGIYIGAMIEDAINIIIHKGIQKQKIEKTYIQYEVKKLKYHLKQADKIGARYCAIIGEDELKNNQIWVKDLQLGSDITIDISKY